MVRRFMIFLLVLFPGIAVSQTVSNVRFQQEGQTIRVLYDLSSPAYTYISVEVSIDGGKSFDSIAMKHVSGDVGHDISEGNGKSIIWDVLQDCEELKGDRICFKVGAYKFLKVFQDFTETAFGINMRMVYVEGGTFTMGCTSDQGGECESDESPNRMTTVGSFYIGMLEVTQSQWEKVMGTSIYQQRNKANSNWDTYGVGSDYPMYYVSWEEAKEFCARLSRQTGRNYSLPTEAEWEYAARGGKKNEGTKYAGGWSIDDVAWYSGNSSESTHMCGTKRPNALGLYDMSGNVWEWCEDWYGSQYLQYDNNNPKGASTGSYRVLRGGGWISDAKRCRVAFRGNYGPGYRSGNYGFRVVLH